MAGVSLLSLIDDIATLLDDIAVLSKVAAKKTAGVLGDDLALNAEQVSGVKAQRELPVVWAVTKGSLLNKVILVPAALLISAVIPSLITVLLVLGALFLCYEGAEKLAHYFIHKQDNIEQHQQKLAAIASPGVDLVSLERDKIKGAIRTDFVLSAEIVVIILGSVQSAPFQTQVLVLSGLALVFTIGVYGLVAAIVKMDDLGLYLLRKSVSGSFNTIQRSIGRLLLIIAPKLMHLLSVVGTVAMFLVGGGIIVHSFHLLNEFIHYIVSQLAFILGSVADVIMPIILEGIIGLIAGIAVLAVVSLVNKIRQ